MALTRRAAGLETFTAYDASQILQDLAPDVIIQGALDYPVLDQVIGWDGPTPTSMYHTWADDDYDVVSVTVNEELDNSETAITLSSGGLDLEEGTLLEVDSEIMWVTTITNDTTITVTRGVCSSSAATHSTGVTAYVIGQATYDNTSYPTAQMGTRTPVGNYLQQMLVPVEVTDIERLLDNVGTSDELDYQLSKKLKKAMTMLELAVLRGNVQSTPQGSATVASTMKGIKNFISTNSTSASSARLTQATLRSAINLCDDYGGNPDTILCGRFQKGIIDSWNEGRTVYQPNEMTAGRANITQYQDLGRVLNVVWSRNMPADEVYIIESERVKLCPLRSFAVRDFSKISTSTRVAIWGVYTLEFRGEKFASKITSLATT